MELLDLQKIVVVTCDMYKDEGGFRLTAIKFTEVEDYLKENIREMTFKLENTKDLEDLANKLSK